MTITQMLSATLLLALATPAVAQQVTVDVEAIAQANEPDRAQGAQERAEERAAARAAARAEAEAARAQGRVERDGNNFKVFVPPIGPIGPFGPAIDADALYDQARQAIENSQFDRAIRDFDRLLADKLAKVNDKFSKADAAMYWKAYSQAKLDMSQEALATVAELSKQFAASPWVKDARALAVEVQQAAGQPVSAELQNDEELKLLALRGVMQADPDKGVPIIEKMLAGNAASPRVRDRALFVLSQSRAVRARDVMLSTAKNSANPDLQRTAIRYLGMMGGAEGREALTGIYRSATDPSVKRAILQSYFMNGSVEQTAEIAKTEKDSELQRTAIRNLGMMNRNGSTASDALVSIYKSDTQLENRRLVINSLFMQHNARALVDLARAEKDSSLKKEIVSKLSVMKTPEATDYMLELLK